MRAAVGTRSDFANGIRPFAGDRCRGGLRFAEPANALSVARPGALQASQATWQWPYGSALATAVAMLSRITPDDPLPLRSAKPRAGRESGPAASRGGRGCG